MRVRVRACEAHVHRRARVRVRGHGCMEIKKYLSCMRYGVCTEILLVLVVVV